MKSDEGLRLSAEQGSWPASVMFMVVVAPHRLEAAKEVQSTGEHHDKEDITIYIKHFFHTNVYNKKRYLINGKENASQSQKFL